MVTTILELLSFATLTFSDSTSNWAQSLPRSVQTIHETFTQNGGQFFGFALVVCTFVLVTRYARIVGRRMKTEPRLRYQPATKSFTGLDTISIYSKDSNPTAVRRSARSPFSGPYVY